MFAKNLLASIAAASILLATFIANAAQPAAAAPVCAKATMIREDGAIVTRTVCVVSLPVARGGK
jgi:hypothetical protein